MASHLQQGHAGGDAGRPGHPYFHLAQNTGPARISSLAVNLDASERLPNGFGKFLDMKTGVIYYMKNGENDDAIGRNGIRHPIFEARRPRGGSTTQSEISSLISPHARRSYAEEVSSSCNAHARARDITSLTLMGCPSCHKYTMTAAAVGDESVMCSKCGVILIDFINEKSTD